MNPEVESTSASRFPTIVMVSGSETETANSPARILTENCAAKGFRDGTRRARKAKPTSTSSSVPRTGAAICSAIGTTMAIWCSTRDVMAPMRGERSSGIAVNDLTTPAISTSCAPVARKIIVATSE